MSSAHSRFLRRYGPWAVITGASSGIGRATTLRLAERGFAVALVARRAAALTSLGADIRTRFGVETRTIVLDLADRGAADALNETTRDLDVGLLVAAAGYGTSGAFLDADEATESEMLDVNCRAVLQQTLAFARRFGERGSGGIVLMGSLVGLQGVPYSAHYAATKAYVQTLAEGLHVELASRKVDVLAAAPGPVRSGFEARSGMRMGAAVDPDAVARGMLAALGRRMTVRPGVLSELLTWSLAPLSRSLRARIMGRIMDGMTRHRREGTLLRR